MLLCTGNYLLFFPLVASLLSCLHQLKHENVKLEARLTDLVKRRDHLLLVNSRLSKPSNLSAASSPSLTQDVKRAEIASPNVLESSRNSSLERNNQALSGKSPENGPSEVDALPKDGQEQTAKQQDLKIQSQTKEQLTTKKEQQQQRQRTHSDLPQTVKESSQQILDKKSPIKVDTPPNIDERLREAASSPPRGNKTTAEGKLATVSLSSIAGERPPNRQSPKSRKSPQGGGGKKMKSQEQLLQQEHQKIMQQQHQQLKQQQLNRQKFQQSHLLPLQQGNQQFNQHFAHQNSQLAFFKLPGYNGSEQHAMHQAKQGQMNGSPQQYNSQSLSRQFANFVPYMEPSSIHNVRMQGYMPVYPVENPLNKVMEEKMDSSAGMDKTERRN
ncbi:Hypothetical predicted protein [Paramuricea clavata]|uniref:Uncharacterized protein n=1 Tax=Paramuricea clavata TaxID=317549 RepID=A0A6S7JCY5_PARCT|nr:Hypothetical predicted protein [Paramuricea clavata]